MTPRAALLGAFHIATVANRKSSFANTEHARVMANLKRVIDKHDQLE